VNKELMTAFHEVAGHRAPHDAESDETDLCHVLRLQRGGNHGLSHDVYHAQVMEGDVVNRLQVAMSIRV
jgi:hydroxypyruvate isomerase